MGSLKDVENTERMVGYQEALLEANIEFDEAEHASTQVKGNLITSTYVR